MSLLSFASVRLPRRIALATTTFLAFAIIAWGGCSQTPAAVCDGATCVCEPGASCSFGCPAPPCSAVCAGDNPTCAGLCANGDCQCGPRATCDLACESAPCHAFCAAGSTCAATCADGDCECAAGATCDFTCLSGPCHVKCEGNNPHCNGQCANGGCTCAAGSDCRFACTDGDCHVNCDPGAKCILDCPGGNAGKGCEFTSCGAGSPIACSDGRTTACGTACPM